MKPELGNECKNAPIRCCFLNLGALAPAGILLLLHPAAATFPALRLHQVVPNSTGMRACSTSILRLASAVARRVRKSLPLILFICSGACVSAPCFKRASATEHPNY